MHGEDEVAGLHDYMGANAERLAAQYESGSFEEIHRSWIGYLPQKGARVVDIGTGSGRDAYALEAAAS